MNDSKPTVTTEQDVIAAYLKAMADTSMSKQAFDDYAGRVRVLKALAKGD